MNELLLVGDSRLRGYFPRGERFKELKVSVLTRSGGNMEELMNLLNGRVNNKVKVIIVIGFFCDITYLSCLPDGSYKGLSKIKIDIDYSNITLNVTYWSRKLEREYGTKVIWTVPYIPDFLKCNKARVERLKMEPMNRREERECIEAAWLMEKHCDELLKRLGNAAVLTVDLRKAKYMQPALAEARDGLHLSKRGQEEVLTQAVDEALNKSKENKETPEHVKRDNLFTPKRRKYNRDRRRKNRMRKTLKRKESEKKTTAPDEIPAFERMDAPTVAMEIIKRHGSTEVSRFLAQ